MNDPKSTTETEKEPAWGRWMLFVGVGVLVIFAIIASIQYMVVNKFVTNAGADGVTKFGISGDFFGFLNALFSALAFAMIIVTLWMQKYELKQQRKELDQTQEIMKLQIAEMDLQRQEMQDQRKEMQDQNESLRRQRFENTFFEMLQLHITVVSGLRSRLASDKNTGRDVFELLLHDLQIKSNSPNGQSRPVTLHIYESWYPNREPEIGHYFRTLYNLFRFIDDSHHFERFRYARLVRAQLSSKELELLLYNCLSKWGKKFKFLVEEYGVLKHLRESPELAKFRSEYSPRAFPLDDSSGDNSDEGSN